MAEDKDVKPEAKVLLQSERLRIRELVDADLDNLVILNGDPAVMRYIHPGKKCTPETERLSIRRNRALYAAKPGFGVWAVETPADSKFIGLAILKELYNTGEIELGYRFIPEAWGQGYASEVAALLVQHAFATLKLDMIVGITMPGNLASRRVLVKAGMDYKGERTFPESESICPALSYYQMRRPEKT